MSFLLVKIDLGSLSPVEIRCFMKMGIAAVCVAVTLLGLCFQAHVVGSQSLGCDSRDLEALRGLLKDLESGIAGWDNASSDCCGWPGVACEAAGGRVAELHLGNTRLRGVVSESLSGLEELKILNLSRNSLIGSLPPALLRFPRLEVLDLSYNELSEALPVDNSLPNLQYFDVSFNAFVGRHPVLTGSANLSSFIISYNQFSGGIDASFCNLAKEIKLLHFSKNSFSGTVPTGFANCSSLRELSLDSNRLTGNLPDELFTLSSLEELYLQGNLLSGPLNERIGNLSNLSSLDVSLNRFDGKIPDTISQLKRLETFNAESNFFSGYLPSSLSNLPSIRFLNLRNNSLRGEININCERMVNLTSLELGSNGFDGRGLDNLSLCRELRTLNLARNNLGRIPESFKNLGSLSYLSLTGSGLRNIADVLSILQQCGNLTTLVLTSNFHGGETMPSSGIYGFKSIELLVIPNCGLLGSIPPWLSSLSNLQLLDLSWNHLEGSIPAWIGDFNKLFYLDLSNNSLSGEIPLSLTKLDSLISGNISLIDAPNNFPFFSRRNQSGQGLRYNQITSFPPTLDLGYNNLVGPIWPEFENLKKLHFFDLSHNHLSGSIPSELSGMMSLENLDLSFNDLSGSIPASLTDLSFLSNFNVANNSLSGPIPSGGQFSTFPPASFQGNLGLCGPHLSACSPAIFHPSQRSRRSKATIIGMTMGIGLGTAGLLAVVFLYVSRAHVRTADDAEADVLDVGKHVDADFCGSNLVLLFHNKDHKEITIDDLLKSTNNFDQANIIGCGGFGLVYKATLPDGRKVAIKRLSGDCGQIEREFQAEVEALSRAQHKNLVSLQGYCRYGNDRLLMYSYMENGSLDYWLHENLDDGSALDWATRLQIAQGAARGLAYLHQSCQPHILHRDIKSSNILLDENFEAHLADFGLARLILPYDTHVTTDLVGTLGYIPPEYGQASVATFKGDVYSFGVVLLELVTGKRPMDVCKPRGCRDLIAWVLQMKLEKREKEVFDPFIYDKENEKQLLQVLEIAYLCLNGSPKLRPFVQQIVSWLDNIGLDG